MLYLLMAVVSSAMVSILMRISEKYVRDSMVMFSANYAACMVISMIYMGDIRSPAFMTGTNIAVIPGAVTGFLYLAEFILLQENITCNGVIFSGAAMKLGWALVPTIAAVLLFQERVKWLQLAGNRALMGQTQATGLAGGYDFAALLFYGVYIKWQLTALANSYH